MKLTEKQALIKTRDMWIWLRDNPHMDKSDYFRVKKTPHKRIPENGCYLCEYVSQKHNEIQLNERKAKKCPLYGYWGNEHEQSLLVNCCRFGAPYFDWQNAGSKVQAKKAAGRLAVLCNKALKDKGYE